MGWEVVPSGRGFLDTRPYRFPSVLPPRLQWLTPSIVQPTRSLRSLLPLFLFLPIQLPPASSLPHSRTARTYFNVVSLASLLLPGRRSDRRQRRRRRRRNRGEVGETAAAVADHNSPSVPPSPSHSLSSGLVSQPRHLSFPPPPPPRGTGRGSEETDFLVVMDLDRPATLISFKVDMSLLLLLLGRLLHLDEQRGTANPPHPPPRHSTLQSRSRESETSLSKRQRHYVHGLDLGLPLGLVC